MLKLLLILTLAFLNGLGTPAYSQSIDVTKQFISDAISSYPPVSYRVYALFGNEALYSDLIGMIGVTSLRFESSAQNRILVYNRVLLDDGGPVLSVTYMFDVKGITSINTTSEVSKAGTIYKKLMINMSAKYYSVKITESSYSDKTATTWSVVELPLGTTDVELEKVRDALLHLCKLYGGSPLPSDLFKKN